MDYEYNLLHNEWVHPEAGTRIYDEDMPWELIPAQLAPSL